MTEAAGEETVTEQGAAHATPEPCAGDSLEAPPEAAVPVLSRERSNRIGVYAAEHDVLVKVGWNVRFRLESKALGVPTITADILPPKGGLEAGPQSFFRLTAWALTPIAESDLQVVRERVLRLTGKLPAWDAPIHMDDELWLVVFAAWRDSFEGSLPPGFPLALAKAAA